MPSYTSWKWNVIRQGIAFNLDLHPFNHVQYFYKLLCKLLLSERVDLHFSLCLVPQKWPTSEGSWALWVWSLLYKLYSYETLNFHWMTPLLTGWMYKHPSFEPLSLLFFLFLASYKTCSLTAQILDIYEVSKRDFFSRWFLMVWFFKCCSFVCLFYFPQREFFEVLFCFIFFFFYRNRYSFKTHDHFINCIFLPGESSLASPVCYVNSW